MAVHDKHALEASIILLAAVGASIHGVDYAYYTAAIASAALIAADLPHPTNYAAEGRRVLFTFIGVGIGALRSCSSRTRCRNADQQQRRPDCSNDERSTST